MTRPVVPSWAGGGGGGGGRCGPMLYDYGCDRIIPL